MSIRLEDDPRRPGFAIVRLEPARPVPPSVSIQFIDGSFLASDGRRTRHRTLFATAPHAEPDSFELGAAVTAHVREDEIVWLADQDDQPLGAVSWEGIRPPPLGGPTTLVGWAREAEASLPEFDAAATAMPDPWPEQDDDPQPSFPFEEEIASLAIPPPEGPAAPAAAPRRGWRRRAATGVGLALLLAAAGFAALVLSGLIGWTVDDAVLAFSGPAGGPFRPPSRSARLRASWYAMPAAPLIRRPFLTAGGPPWLALSQIDEGEAGWTLRGAILSSPSRGAYDVDVPVVFPLGGTIAGRKVRVVLRVRDASAPIRPLERAGLDDAACDRVAGNRLDPDHPAGHGFSDEVFNASPADIDRGIVWCDARTDRAGPDRRLIVQRGRLLAARAMLRVAGGDIAGARQDMADAVAAWQAGAALGSGFAENLLGAYAFGAFNRPAVAFVEPDAAKASELWSSAMRHGSLTGQRNFAAQVMSGHGVAADPARGIALLRDAMQRGDERAAGVLGVALYTGFPPGVPLDKVEGWSLIERAQCLDAPSMAIVSGEIERGTRPASDRRTCP